MKARVITERVEWLGAVDWDRRLFDSFIHLPDGTSYNAYLVEGSEKVALIDAVDPDLQETFLRQLAGIERIDYVVSHHAEQDHSGTIPLVLERYPEAVVLATSKAKAILMDHLDIAEERFQVVADGESISLGDRTLRFLHMPWVHWPDTMVTWLEEERILFTCDLFGSHIASTELYDVDEARVFAAAKRYFAEIMHPYRALVRRHLGRLGELDIAMIAPSHGPVYRRPAYILDAYASWASDTPTNMVLLPYVSMHGSTRLLVDRLTAELADRGVAVERFDLTVTDVGQLAVRLVDAGTIVFGTPTFLNGPHPHVATAAYFCNLLKPKAKRISVIGSYGWAGKAVKLLAEMVPSAKAQLLDPVMAKGHPSAEDFEAIDRLAETIAEEHAAAGLEALRPLRLG